MNIDGEAILKDQMGAGCSRSGVLRASFRLGAGGSGERAGANPADCRTHAA